MSVQPAKPASSIRLLCEELTKVYVFPEHKLFTTFCAPFSIEYLIQDLGFALGLWAMFIADMNPRKPCVFRSLEVGNTFLISSYSKAK